jgi:putative heme-binding domain-containing protein
VECNHLIGQVALWILFAGVGVLADDGPAGVNPSELLESQLRREDPAVLAADAKRLGDARRGALFFFRPASMCTTCHAVGGPDVRTLLGPDLSARQERVNGVEIVESILQPSKAMKKGFETVMIVTDDGRTASGLLAENRPDAIVLRDSTRNGKLITVLKSRIEQQNDRGPSLMPAGLINTLASRQQFLDLVCYLIEIAEKGPARAQALRPDPALLAPTLSAYEHELDHRGLIAALGQKAFERGEAIYGRVCANCHGTKDQPGSLPTAPRFAVATLKNGSDPYHLYRTLTDGFGQMAAQSWMVPRQKYDVIHYVRESFLKNNDANKYAGVDRAYLDQLPKGTSRGPAPAEIEPWTAMDYGPSLAATVEVGRDGSNIAYKGVAVRLDAGQGGISRGHAWMLYEQDTLRLAAAWTGKEFIDWNGINFNGRHQVHPRAVGRVHLTNASGPGWANPRDDRFTDLRVRGRDGRYYGPLPRSWAHFKGQYRHGDRVILAYTAGTAEVLETPGIETDPAHPDAPIFTRTLEIGPSPDNLTMRVAGGNVAVSLSPSAQASLVRRDGFTLLRVPRSRSTRLLKLFMSSGSEGELIAYEKSAPPVAPVSALTHGGPRRWPEILTTKQTIGRDDGPFAVDVLTVPESNPWNCQMRPSGFDFLPDGRRAAVCTWDGDVWLVGGLDEPSRSLTWQRIASGLFQPLGLKIVDGQIFVTCRDQIVRLRDLNGDGETDLYENFNSDHQVTEHFHEFAMGLQTDSAGNFYYAKAACHGLPAVVPQHGTLLRVSPDGMRTEILATGFRAPNGVCLNADGTFFLSDQEGFWTPKNRINWVKTGGFYGNMWGYHDVTDSSDTAMEQPLCWITNAMDRSPAELIWVESNHAAWKPLRGALLSLSYGNGKIFVVPHELVGGGMQGGVCALPIPALPTGVMRGRFNPVDGQLYTCGLFAWAGDRTQPGGFYRIRATGKPLIVPTGLSASTNHLAITFAAALDEKYATEVSHYTARIWSLKRSASYGSDHYNERPVAITGAKLSDDGRTVVLEVPGLNRTWCMEVTFAVRTKSAELGEGVIHNTIHHLSDQ